MRTRGAIVNGIQAFYWCARVQERGGMSSGKGF
jgi:hypothetical protein